MKAWHVFHLILSKSVKVVCAAALHSKSFGKYKGAQEQTYAHGRIYEHKYFPSFGDMPSLSMKSWQSLIDEALGNYKIHRQSP